MPKALAADQKEIIDVILDQDGVFLRLERKDGTALEEGTDFELFEETIEKPQHEKTPTEAPSEPEEPTAKSGDDCSVCKGTGLIDQNTLCSACKGSGKVS